MKGLRMEDGISGAKRFVGRHKIKLGVLAACLLLWLFCLPNQLFDAPTSTVVNSSDGSLIGARIADDGQWRFPEMDSVPPRFRQAILLFEDEYFEYHPGFNPVSILKAIAHNLRRESRRGGSTITQQIIRLSRKGKARTYWEKCIEILMATRLEARSSKDELLRLYASHTPYGGNVVGLGAASWRYFGIPPQELSWGQAASLAVLPNAPSLVFPGRNEQLFLHKRNRLLEKLRDRGILDGTTYELALAEPLPQKPLALPDLAPHLTQRIAQEHPGARITSSIDRRLQGRLNELANRHYQQLKQNEIHNLAILVLEVESRKVLAYVGNSPTTATHARDVDIITRNRSSGSILKPMLFASLLDEGQLLPRSLVADVPTVINGYNPQNFDRMYQGAVAVDRALSQSLNVPAVRLLRSYGLEKFHNRLKKMNIASLDRPASHYGLSLILGGGESSLWEITSSYAGMASTLNHFVSASSTYREGEYTAPTYLLEDEIDFGKESFNAPLIGAGAIYSTFRALYEVNRPEGDQNWHFFDSSRPIAWKTGTSFGFKDAWAVGSTPKYTIGVWAGNADGEGRPGLTGITAAAPLLFDVLDVLPDSGWFQEPYDDLTQIEVCSQSGFRASLHCDAPTLEYVPAKGTRSGPCPFHHQLFLDRTGSHRVSSDCYPLEDMQARNWFSLPPVQEYFYARSHPEYRHLPPYGEGCSSHQQQVMEFIYPKAGEVILLPRTPGMPSTDILMKLAHLQADAKVYWYLDDTYRGKTENFHELVLDMEPGEYLLTAVDDRGNRVQQSLQVRMATQR